MSRSVPNALSIETDDSAARADKETRITDFAAFFALSFPTMAVPVIGVPMAEVAALALGLLTLLRRPADGRCDGIVDADRDGPRRLRDNRDIQPAYRILIPKATPELGLLPLVEDDEWTEAVRGQPVDGRRQSLRRKEIVPECPPPRVERHRAAVLHCDDDRI